MGGEQRPIDGRTRVRVVRPLLAFGLALAVQMPAALASHISEEQAIEAYQALKERVDRLEADNAGQQEQIDALFALIYSLLPDRRTVFVTSRTYAPVVDFGGLEDADALCQRHATEAGLSGTYKAWLSDELTSAASRFDQSAGPYVLTDGSLVAVDWDDLVDCTNPNCLRHTISLDEYQAPAAGDYVWTGTTQAGGTDYYEGTCVSWTVTETGGAAGRIESVGGWTSVLYGRYCGLSLHLYCFQQ